MMTLESQLAEYGQMQDEMFGPISLDEVTTRPVGVERRKARYLVFGRHPAALAFAAMVAVLLVIGGIALLTGRTDEPDPVDQPTTGTFTWTSQTASDETLTPQVQTMVSNGEILLGTSFDGLTWTSPDGLTWSEGSSDFRAHALPGIVGEFLVHTGGGIYWRSDDGKTWRELPASSQLPIGNAVFWLGLTVDEIVSLSEPEILVDGHPAGVVVKAGDRFVTYYWTPGHDLEGAVSDDGQAWDRFEVPEFLTEWFDPQSPRAMPDRGLSMRLWSETFAVGHDKVLALTADAAGQHLWESTDGVAWDELGSTLPDSLVSPPDFVEQSFGLATHHVSAMSTGWSLTPWDGSWSPPGSSTYYSVDGRTWQTVSPPDFGTLPSQVIRVVGDKILFFIDYGTSETFEAVHVATLDDRSITP